MRNEKVHACIGSFKLTAASHQSMLTCALAQKSEPLLEARQNQPKAVAGAADTPLLMYYAPRRFSAQQFGNGTGIHSSVQGQHGN